MCLYNFCLILLREQNQPAHQWKSRLRAVFRAAAIYLHTRLQRIHTLTLSDRFNLSYSSKKMHVFINRRLRLQDVHDVLQVRDAALQGSNPQRTLKIQEGHFKMSVLNTDARCVRWWRSPTNFQFTTQRQRRGSNRI